MACPSVHADTMALFRKALRQYIRAACSSCDSITAPSALPSVSPVIFEPGHCTPERCKCASVAFPAAMYSVRLLQLIPRVTARSTNLAFNKAEARRSFIGVFQKPLSLQRKYQVIAKAPSDIAALQKSPGQVSFHGRARRPHSISYGYGFKCL